MEFDLARLRHIVTVARNASFSGAAEELHITQPALSRSIAAFERGFGIRLFDRGRGGASMTQVGELVVAEAERLLRSAGDFEHNLKLYGGGEAGRVAIGLDDEGLEQAFASLGAQREACEAFVPSHPGSVDMRKPQHCRC